MSTINLLLLLIIPIQITSFASIEQCNFEAIPTFSDNRLKCKCIEGYWKGPRCQEKIDWCTPNPCLENAPCENFFGHYHCKCPHTLAGQNCTQGNRKEPYKGFHIHFNHLAETGVEQAFLITFQEVKQSTSPTLLELSTETYFILGTLVRPMTFTQSSNLKQISRKLGLRHSETLPYNRGVYLVTKATFWQTGHQELTVGLKFFDEIAGLYRHSFAILVYDNHEMSCHPVARQESCENPRKLVRMAVNKFNYVDPKIERSCGTDSKLSFQYYLKDYLDKDHIHTFLNANKRFLKIPPYHLGFNYDSLFFENFFLVEGRVREVSADGKKSGLTRFRCYFELATLKPKAVIVGGTERQVDINKPFTLDGRKSRDFNKPTGENQELKFQWICSTPNTTRRSSQFCKADMGRESVLLINQSLEHGLMYTFTLKVTTNLAPFESDSTTQSVTGNPDANPLLLHIDCIRNCDRNLFSNNELLHLRVDCYNCHGKSVEYEWKPHAGQDQRLVVLPSDFNSNSDSIEISVQGISNAFLGKSSMALRKNEPPSGGKCEITPSSGIELETKFRIHCAEYRDEDLPLSFNYYLGGRIAAQSLTSRLELELYQTREGTAELKIDICDDLRACTSQELEVQLIESEISFADQHDDAHRQIVALHILIRKLKAIPESDYKRMLFQGLIRTISSFDYATVTLTDQLSSCLLKLLEAIDIDSEYIVVHSVGFQTLLDNLLEFITSGEYLEINSAEFYTLHKDVFKALEKIGPRVDKYNAVHNMELQRPDNPFEENYPDYGDIKFEIIETISNWQKSFHRMLQYLHYLGSISFNLLEPNEPPLTLNTIACNLTIIALEKSNLNVEVIQQHLGEAIKLNRPILEEFSQKANANKMAIQAVFFSANPFQWYPDQFPPASPIKALNVFGNRANDYRQPIVTRNYFTIGFDMHRRVQSLSSFSSPIYRRGFIKVADDMPVYEMTFPRNALITIEFKDFTRDMRLVFTQSTRPRGYMMLDGYNRVSKNQTRFLFLNTADIDTVAYMALTPFDMHAGDLINFTAAIYTHLCVLWDVDKQEWSSAHCLPSEENATLDKVQCKCNHLSTFASKIYVTPNSLHISRVLVLEVTSNLKVSLFFLGLALFFLVILLLAWHRDRKEAFVITVLDTSSEDQVLFEYLISVHTGNLPQSGTTANVRITLHGHKGISNEIILCTNNAIGQYSFKKNSVFVFLLQTDTDYGRLTHIQIGHDNFGIYPSWYCQMVRIKDKHNKSEYIFLVDRWFSLIKNTATESTIALATKRQLSELKFLFCEYFNTYASNAFVWRILDKSQSGNLRRREKIFLLWIQIMVAGVCMILFYGRTTVRNVEEELETHEVFFITMGRMLLVGLLCVGVSGVVVAAVRFMFVASKGEHVCYKVVYGEE